MPLRILVYQHMSRDTPGLLGEAFQRRGAALDINCLYQAEPVRDPAGYDALLIMGGDMNVYQEEQYPWLAPETAFIRQAALRDQPTLGVCLGGQLLARALGAIVRLGGAPEIGLAEIVLNAAGQADPLFAGLGRLEITEWHDDTFDIPAGAVALASSAGCANQAFRYGARTYGLQFHPEVTPGLLEEWIAAAPYLPLDDQRALRAYFASRYAALQVQADGLVENFLRLSFGPGASPH
jgi:GMP synthase-like glutamine amidotransferase